MHTNTIVWLFIDASFISAFAAAFVRGVDCSYIVEHDMSNTIHYTSAHVTSQLDAPFRT